MVAPLTFPCPCGYHDEPVRECTCSPSAVSRYKEHISGPLLDRFDLFVEVPRVEYEKLVAPADGETSADVRRRIAAARRRQQTGYEGVPAGFHRILKVSRTIADRSAEFTLSQAEGLTAGLAEALRYRPRETAV